MAQYRNIQDVPLILVGTQGINSFPILFPVIVCEHHFSPVKFRLKTFLLSEDRFQYKGAAHSKLTRPAWWYQPNTLDHFCLTQRSFKIVEIDISLKCGNILQAGLNTLRSKGSLIVLNIRIPPHPSWLQTQWGSKQNLFAQSVFCMAAFSGPVSLRSPVTVETPKNLECNPSKHSYYVLNGNNNILVILLLRTCQF